MLNIEELEELLDLIKEKVLIANRTGDLNNIILCMGIDVPKKTSAYETYKKGKIVLIGNSKLKEKDFLGIAKTLGVDKNRFEFCLDYERAKTYEYRKLRYNPNYRVVIFGPIPHSTTGKNQSRSVISDMQRQEGYPRVEVLTANGEIKITKTSFTKMLENLVLEEYI